MDISEMLRNIISEIAESDISAHDFKVVNDILEKYLENENNADIKIVSL